MYAFFLLAAAAIVALFSSFTALILLAHSSHSSAHRMLIAIGCAMSMTCKAHSAACLTIAESVERVSFDKDDSARGADWIAALMSAFMASIASVLAAASCTAVVV